MDAEVDQQLLWSQVKLMFLSKEADGIEDSDMMASVSIRKAVWLQGKEQKIF